MTPYDLAKQIGAAAAAHEKSWDKHTGCYVLSLHEAICQHVDSDWQQLVEAALEAWDDTIDWAEKIIAQTDGPAQ